VINGKVGHRVLGYKSPCQTHKNQVGAESDARKEREESVGETTGKDGEGMDSSEEKK